MYLNVLALPPQTDKMLKNLTNLLFPTLCYGCEALLLKNEALICAACRHQLPLTQHHKIKDNYIAKKFYGILPLEFNAAMLYFHKEGIAQQLIHNLKYRGHQEIGTFLGNWYANDLKEIALKHQFSEIIPVPLHKKRFQERGFNQVTTFCKALSEGLQIDYNEALLYRTMHTKTQTKKSKEERTTVKNALFDINFSEKDAGKHFLIVDDVITSGATLEACANALLKIPDVKISIITIAYSDS